MSHEKILIVEDEENERSGLAELVSSWGFRVETARDGAEGLDKATQWSPSIVITDLKMPRMGGIELLGQPRGTGHDDRRHPGHRPGDHRQRRTGHANGRLRLHHQAHRHQPPADDAGQRLRPCWARAPNSKPPGAGCGTRDRWGGSTAPRARCRRSSGSSRWSRPAPPRC